MLPAELAIKLDCLYHHRSQRSQTPFTETQAGEGWQQAEQINRETAQHYDRLGLAEYEAIESFECTRKARYIPGFGRGASEIASRYDGISAAFCSPGVLKASARPCA